MNIHTTEICLPYGCESILPWKPLNDNDIDFSSPEVAKRIEAFRWEIETTAQFWEPPGKTLKRPKPGDFVIGYFKDFALGTFGKVAILLTLEGPRFCGPYPIRILKGIYKEVFIKNTFIFLKFYEQQIYPGDLVCIKYLGKYEDSDRGRGSIEVYDVIVDNGYLPKDQKILPLSPMPEKLEPLPRTWLPSW